MPFQSEKQRKYLWANEPEIARDWTDKYGSRVKKLNGGITRIPFANGGFDTNLLDYYLQKDPLLDVYKSQGLLAEENILPYSADPKATINPAWAREMDEDTLGYTRPGLETNLYLNELEKFGMQPSGPLYGKPTMDKEWLDKLADDYFSTGLQKNPHDRTQTNREWMTEYLNAPKRSYKRSFALDQIDPDISWSNPTITERNKQIGETIGHEARHQLLGQNREFEENINDALLTNIGTTGTGKHELLNRMLDFQAYNDAGIYGDIYGDMHGNMPRHLSSPIADAFSDQATAFTNKMLLPKDEEDVNLGEEVRRLIEDVNLGGVSRRSVQRRPVQGAAATTKQNFINRLRNRFYKPATRPAGGYGIAQLNRMNALGGHYSEPAREQRRQRSRVSNMLARQAAGKSYSQKNLNQLTMGSRPGHYDPPGGGGAAADTSPSTPGNNPFGYR